MSKKEGTFKCCACHSKETTLRRMFGKWPLPQFTQLDEDIRRTFFSSMDGASRDGLKMELERISSMTSFEDYFSDGGEYLPLSVWKTRGSTLDCDLTFVLSQSHGHVLVTSGTSLID